MDSGVMNDLMEACFDIGILTGVDSAELQVIEFPNFNLADPIKKSSIRYARLLFGHSLKNSG